MERSSLQSVFTSFAGGAYEMDGRQFAKLPKDCKLLDRKLTATDIDLIFAKIKDRTARKVTFIQFKSALALFADKKGVNLADIESTILKVGGPHF